MIVDEDIEYRDQVVHFFSGMDHQTEQAGDFEEALRAVSATAFDVVICDASLHGGDRCARLVAAIKEKRAETAILILHSDPASIQPRLGEASSSVFRILQKPLSNAELHFQTKRALEESKDKRAAPSHDREDVSQHSEFIGQSPEIKKIFRMIARMAKTDASVLILGETGTGKELIARTIHEASLRADGPFVRVNCAALPEQLLESELFGYEKGAFTGADRMRVGRFEHANGGTIFLDEVADMSLLTQAKLLRVCQQKEFERLGSNHTVKTDTRIVSATNKDLLALIRKGLFREDLFYRLNVMNIRLPPIRERGEDISLLLHYILKRLSAKMRTKIRGFRSDALDILTKYRWPGNIREMENTIERAVLMAEGDQIVPDDIEFFSAAAESDEASPKVLLPPGGISLLEVERQLISQALTRCDGVQKEAADLLGISPRVLNYKIKHVHGIEEGTNR